MSRMRSYRSSRRVKSSCGVSSTWSAPIDRSISSFAGGIHVGHVRSIGLGELPREGPTAPPAPLIRTVCPAWTRPSSRTCCTASDPDVGTAAACSNVRPARFDLEHGLRHGSVLRRKRLRCVTGSRGGSVRRPRHPAGTCVTFSPTYRPRRPDPFPGPGASGAQPRTHEAKYLRARLSSRARHLHAPMRRRSRASFSSSERSLPISRVDDSGDPYRSCTTASSIPPDRLVRTGRLIHPRAVSRTRNQRGWSRWR